ncbi:MAG: sedoheptulose-bisphosphatase precursor [Trebouxia sp. A1-2]|nr:MAG: sedoheptulose-bisphosphatase precursor [Trebouxia sp. A1-2]
MPRSRIYSEAKVLRRVTAKTPLVISNSIYAVTLCAMLREYSVRQLLLTGLQIDVESDEVVFNHLRACGMVKSASSEEQTECQDLGGQGYSVAFDPLDGSSIVGANFAVGSIFGIWPGDELIGRRGSEQAAAVYAVYGPRTVLVVAWPHQGEDPSGQVQEYLLTQHQTGGSQWLLQRGSISIKDKAVFAPANLRATAENEEYQQLVQYWMSNKYTLRYSGGMVPDVHHILTKGGGVFANPVSKSASAKLRLLYEAAPLALIVEAAGGLAECATGSILDVTIASTDIRTMVSLGSKSEVIRSRPALKWQ